MNRNEPSQSDLPAASVSEHARSRLDSWKEIASYLGRSERTVRRWEESEGLPVHRLRHEKRSSVYAYRDELEAWRNRRKEIIEPEETRTGSDQPSAGSYFWWLGSAALLLGIACLRWQIASSLPVITQSVRLTNDDFSKSPELVTDGTRLYFSAWKGGHGALAQVSTAGGDTELMPTPFLGPITSACVRGLSPDRQTLLVATGQQRRTLAGYPLWTVKTSTRASHKVGDIVANDAAWSPDGRQIAYATQNQIWIADTNGTKIHKIAEQGGLTGYPRWSPDGQRIRFTSLAWEKYEQTIVCHEHTDCKEGVELYER